MVRKVIVDCDAGYDDIVAILNLLAYPEKFELLGITTVTGNNLVDKVTNDLLKVLSYIGLKTKVAKGCKDPLICDNYFNDGHFNNLIDGLNLPDASLNIVDMHAVEFIKEMVLIHDKVTIIGLGPLTNIASFMIKYPELKNRIECIALMGGSRASGNISKYAEYNMFIDPHSANIIFKSGILIIMSDLEICLECRSDKGVIDNLNTNRKISDMVYNMLNLCMKRHNREMVAIFDLVVVMQLLHPELYITKECKVEIELDNQDKIGMTKISDGSGCLLVEHVKDCALFNRYLIDNIKKLES